MFFTLENSTVEKLFFALQYEKTDIRGYQHETLKGGKTPIGNMMMII